MQNCKFTSSITILNPSNSISLHYSSLVPWLHQEWKINTAHNIDLLTICISFIQLCQFLNFAIWLILWFFVLFVAFRHLAGHISTIVTILGSIFMFTGSVPLLVPSWHLGYLELFSHHLQRRLRRRDKYRPNVGKTRSYVALCGK